MYDMGDIMLLYTILTSIFMVAIQLFFGVIIKSSYGHGVEGVSSYVMGGVYLFLVYSILSVPMVIFNFSLTSLCVLYMAVSVVFVVILLHKSIKEEYWKSHTINKINIYDIFALIAILVVITFAQLVDVNEHVDDTYFVGRTSEVFFRNKLSPQIDWRLGTPQLDNNRLLATFPIFMSMIAKITGLHTLIVTYRIIPVIVISTAYAIYYLLLKELLPQKHKSNAGLGIVLIALLEISNLSYARYRWSRFLLHPIYGNSIMGALIFPLMWYISIKIFRSERPEKSQYWIHMFATMVVANMFSSNSILFCPILLGIILLYHMILNKNVRYAINGIIMCIPAIVNFVLIKVI